MPTRRNFLKMSALLGTAAGCSAAIGQESNVPEKTMDPTKTFHVPMKEVLKEKTTRRNIIIPDVDGFKVLKGDFHMHTLFSDGLVMPKDRVNDAVDNGLDVISITDHIEYRIFFGGNGKWKLDKRNDDHNLSYDMAKPDADAKKLLLVRGTEITKFKMPPGHFNALFVQDVNPIAAAVDDWKKMLQIAVDQGGFIQWNHPGWVSSSGGLASNQPLDFFPEHEEAYKKGLLHGIEVFNGSEYYPIVSDWCNQRDLAIIANSDIHPSEANRYGFQNPLRPMTLILAKERTIESVKEAFFAKRTIGTAAGQFWGRDPWMKDLFNACVQIEYAPNQVTLTNKSDLPCEIEFAGNKKSLAAQGNVAFQTDPTSAKKFVVTNWLVGMNQPLEVELAPV